MQALVRAQRNMLIVSFAVDVTKNVVFPAASLVSPPDFYDQGLM